MRHHLLTIGVILIGAAGCDNVAFGGVDMAVLPPPTPEVVVDEAGSEIAEGPVNVDGPILLAGVREGARATLTLVGEVDGGAIRPFPDPRFEEDADRLTALTAPGSEWILFSEGARVGRLFTDSSGTATDYCGGRATVSGVVELVPAAAVAERLLALPSEDGDDRPYSEYEAISDAYAQRVATIEIAQAAIPEYGATWPRQGVLDARKDIRVFSGAGSNGPYVAATFMYADDLTIGAPGQGAYALFVLGRRVGDAYERAYTWYRAVDTDGKGAPRYFDRLDWDGDGTEEILLDVLGANRRWFAGLGRREGEWVRTFQDACESGSTTGG